MKFFFPRLLNKLGILKYLTITVSISLGKNRISVPLIKKIGLGNLLMSEMWMLEVLEKILPLKKGAFLDVGVNIGQTLIKLKSVNNEISYIGFEPNPLCVYYTNELIKINNFKNTKLISAGISTTNKILTLNLFSENEMDSSASLIEEFRPDPIIKKMYVPVFDINTLENRDELFNDVSIIKIDVEGGELEVISSFLTIIEKKRPFILIEILPIYKENNTFRIERQHWIEDKLNHLNYSNYRIEKKKDNSFKSFSKIEKIEIHSDLQKCDYLFVPNELLNKLV